MKWYESANGSISSPQHYLFLKHMCFQDGYKILHYVQSLEECN